MGSHCRSYRPANPLGTERERRCSPLRRRLGRIVRKSLVVLFLVTVLLGVGVGFAAAETDDTDNDDAIAIESVDELQAIEDDLNADYVLADDIDASGTDHWNSDDGFEPIGDNENQFTGSFDGNGYEITGLTIDRPDEKYVGLFSYVGREATVENVSITDATVTGDQYVGTLAGISRGDFSSVRSTGRVKGSESVGGLVGSSLWAEIRYSSADVTVVATGDEIGGLAGRGHTIEGSFATGDVEGAEEVGGLAGYAFDKVNGSYATGTVEGAEEVGGLVGKSRDYITESYATGNVFSRAETETDGLAGGLVGRSTGRTGETGVERSYATGDVVSNGTAGGLAGSADTVVRSYATGNVTGTNRVGGVAGVISEEMNNTYALGAVEGGKYTGGLLGATSGEINDSYAVGPVESDGQAASLVGRENEVSNLYWNSDTIEYETPKATALETDQMQGSRAETAMESFDFENTWTTTKSYPSLQEVPRPGEESPDVSNDEAADGSSDESTTVSADDSDGTNEGGDDSVPGFGIGIGALSLFVATVAVGRRIRD